MTLAIRPISHHDLMPWRARYRAQANCQIVRDSIIGRGMADAFAVYEADEFLGYGAIWNKHYPGQLMEFYVPPAFEARAIVIARELLTFTHATHIEAQTNMPLMHRVLQQLATEIHCEAILFEESGPTNLPAPPGALFRAKAPSDEGSIFAHHHEPVGDCVIELNGEIVATGGYLCHYNPPYGDIYMEVHEPHRRRGIGSYLIQELKRVARENGKTPAARCDPDNIASRRTLERAGFAVCGEMLAGRVRSYS